MTRESLDSREGFDAATEAEYNAYFDATEGGYEWTEEAIDWEEGMRSDNLDEEDEYSSATAEEDWLYEQDLMLEQQEREDFCECDESYGYYGGEWD